jgi:hypothetical protein
MPTTEDLKDDNKTSFLLVGDSGTQKTGFFATCPKPLYIFDTDKGMARLAGVKGIGYDTFKELPRNEKFDPKGELAKEGFYEYGTAWGAILKKINEIGRLIDQGKNEFKVIGFDSLTLLTDVAQSHILKQTGHDSMQQNDWGAFLNNMSQLFGQLTAWPVLKVLTAHIKRDENLITGTTEKLPLVPGQFSGKVSVYFDEVYFTDVKNEGVGDKKIAKYFIHTVPDAVMRQAKSRKYNLPTGTLPPDFQAIMEHVKGKSKLQVVK